LNYNPCEVNKDRNLPTLDYVIRNRLKGPHHMVQSHLC